MVVFDVGAHTGFDGLLRLNSLTRKQEYLTEEDKVYAFEPSPFYLKRYLYNFATATPKNYIVIPKAVSDVEHRTKFNICDKRPGCSSLHNFSDNLEVGWDKTPGYAKSYFIASECIDIETIRLDTVIKQYNIQRIDYLHCDAQGSDYAVLRSLGDYIHRVVKGKVEASVVNPLYKDIDNSIESITAFLKSKNFKIKDTGNDDLRFKKQYYSNEEDVIFYR